MSGDWEREFNILGTSLRAICSHQNGGKSIVLPLSSLRLGFWSLFSLSLPKVTQKYSSVYERKKRNGHSKAYENRGGRN